MLIRKTRAKERTTYTYRFCDGTKIVLRPGVEGITEKDIKMLHALDDAEVYNNIKNNQPPLTEDEKKAKSKWEEEHPGEGYPFKWNLSLDFVSGNSSGDCDDNNDFIISKELFYQESDVDDIEEVLERNLWFLTSTQRKVFYLISVEKLSQVEVAKILGTTKQSIYNMYNKAIKKIEEARKNNDIN